jgi:ubiquinone/menaquinone biosynthesis C-methylase UbiE
MNRHYSAELYSQIADIYDLTRWSGKGQFVDFMQKVLLLEILKEFNNNSSSNRYILDVGTGTGRFIHLFTKFNYNFVGIDISKKMLQKAKLKINEIKRKENGRYYCELIVCDAFNLSFKSCTFDYVISYRVLIHFPNYEKVLNEIYRVLKPQGVAILEFNNKFSLSSLAKIKRKIIRLIAPEKVITDPEVVSPWLLRKQLHAIGFSDVIIYTQFFIPEVIFRKIPVRLLSILQKLDRIFCKIFPFKNIATRLIVVAIK